MSEETNEILSRNQEQEKALFVIYQALFYVRMKKEYDFINLVEDTLDCDYEEASVFVKETAFKTLKNYDEIVNLIKPNLTTWKFERLNLLLVSILLLGIGEYKYVGDVEKPVIIDVCVRMAKKYCDEKDYKFVNAILDKIL